MLADMEPLSAATAAAIARHFDLGEVTSRPAFAARGELGRIWRLDTSSGPWAVKEPLVPIYEADAAKDVEFQLAARAAGISLPLPRLSRDGRVVLPADESATAWGVRVYEWAELAPADRLVTPVEIGAVTAMLHQLEHAGDHGPVPAWFSEPLGPPAWIELLDDASRGEAEWAPALDRWLPELIALDSVITPPDPALVRTCHRDLNIENVRRLVNGTYVVLDWENSGAAEPQRELAAVIWDLAVDRALPYALGGYQAYLAEDGPARLRAPVDFALAAATQGHLLQFYGRRALDPSESAENQARSRSRLDRMLSQPVTLDAIGDLLALLPDN